MALNVVSNAGPLMVFSKLIALVLSKNALLLMDEEQDEATLAKGNDGGKLHV